MVRFTATVENTESILPLEIADDLSLGDFKAYLGAETGIEPEDQVLILNSNELTGDGKTLKEFGISENELLVIRNKKIGSSQEAVPENYNPQHLPAGLETQLEQFRQQVLTNPAVRETVRASNPSIESVVNDPVLFRNAMAASFQNQQQQQPQHQYPGGVSQQEWSRLQSDPDNPDNQKRILELIEKDQIEENMRNALEYSPESFASVTMLYIDVQVNGHPVKAFVDSGAQTTIMSTKLAEECNLSRLIDRRFKGEAHGVGKTEIIGRIHSAPLKIENTFVPCSFVILDTHVDMLLGLDMLKRHQANIDLKRNVLVIADIETKFLGEADIPKINPLFPTATAGNSLSAETPGIAPPSNISASASASAASAALARNTSRHSEESINHLISLGFTRDQVVKALDQANGNMEIAAAVLFQ